jgi:hypothetical protein
MKPRATSCVVHFIMKTRIFATIAALAVCGATAALAASSSAASKATANVSYLEPENFTDFKLSQIGGDSEQQSLESELTKHVERLTATYLPAGTHLNLRFRDIDMAGDFEPFRSGPWNDVRILRSIYPPRMSIEYSVTKDDGTVVASGERKLSDLTYQWNIRATPLSLSNTEIEADLLGNFIRDLSRSVS